MAGLIAPANTVSGGEPYVIEIGHQGVLVPSTDRQGHALGEGEAYAQYLRTGRHLGIFDSPSSARAYLDEHKHKRKAPKDKTKQRNPRDFAEVARTAETSAASWSLPEGEGGPTTPTGRVSHGGAGGGLTSGRGPSQKSPAHVGGSGNYSGTPVGKAPLGTKPGYTVSQATLENYIRASARAHGIDEDVALTVFRAEGAGGWKAFVPTEHSYGPYQLNIHGVGAAFARDTGLDPSNPQTWRENIDYTMNYIQGHGWGAWMGAKARGIYGKRGIKPGARQIPIPRGGYGAHGQPAWQHEAQPEAKAESKPAPLHIEPTVAPGSPRLRHPPELDRPDAGEAGESEKRAELDVGWTPPLQPRRKQEEDDGMYFPADQHGHRNVIRRVIVYQVDDTKPQQKIWAHGLYKEEIKWAYRNQDFGLTSVPPLQSEGYAYSLAGRPDQIYFLNYENPPTDEGKRPLNKKPGETVLYDAFGNTIKLHKPSNNDVNEIHIESSQGKLTAEGDKDVLLQSKSETTTVNAKKTTTVKADQSVTVQAPSVTIDGSGGNTVNIIGNTEHTGGINASGDVTAPNISSMASALAAAQSALTALDERITALGG